MTRAREVAVEILGWAATLALGPGLVWVIARAIQR